VRYFFEEEAFDKQGNLTVPKSRAINKIGHGMCHFPSFLSSSVSALSGTSKLVLFRLWEETSSIHHVTLFALRKLLSAEYGSKHLLAAKPTGLTFFYSSPT
jgi:hypothetical protein